MTLTEFKRIRYPHIIAINNNTEIQLETTTQDIQAMERWYDFLKKMSTKEKLDMFGIKYNLVKRNKTQFRFDILSTEEEIVNKVTHFLIKQKIKDIINEQYKIEQMLFNNKMKNLNLVMLVTECGKILDSEDYDEKTKKTVEYAIGLLLDSVAERRY